VRMPERSQPPVGFQENLLGHVLCVGEVFEIMKREAVDGVLVFHDEGAKGVFVTVYGSFD
jgi:hypothetical protein